MSRDKQESVQNVRSNNATSVTATRQLLAGGENGRDGKDINPRLPHTNFPVDDWCVCMCDFFRDGNTLLH